MAQFLEYDDRSTMTIRVLHEYASHERSAIARRLA